MGSSSLPMVAKDRYGRDLSEWTVKKAGRIVGQLVKAGYTESKRKPGLCFRNVGHHVFFTDMRGTDVIPIWEDFRPFFFWSFDGSSAGMGERRGDIHRELVRLLELGIECRLSFYFSSTPEFEEVSTYLGAGPTPWEWPIDDDDGEEFACGRAHHDWCVEQGYEE